MRLLGNVIWFISGGFIAGLLWYLAGLIAFAIVVGAPWGKACFLMGNFSMAPFGRTVISRKTLAGKGDLGTGSLGILGNLIWFLLAGFWLMLGHLTGAVLCLISCIVIVTIPVAIPFAIQHLKLAGAATFPVGKAVVSIDVSKVARRVDAETQIAKMRRSAGA